MTNTKDLKINYLVCFILMAIMATSGIYHFVTANPDMMSQDYFRYIGVDSLGILVAFTLMLGLMAEENKDRQNRAMFHLIFFLSLLFYVDLVSSIMENQAKYVLAIKVVNTVGFIGEDVLAYCYWVYIREESNLIDLFSKRADKICLASLAITVILDLLNFQYGFFFYITSQGEYIDGPYEFLGDLAIVTMFIMSSILILKIKENTLNEKLILFSFGVSPFLAYVIGALTSEYNWTEPAYLLAALLIYIRIFSQRGKILAEQEVVLTKQSTALMISQIQPHFLYNVLTTISNLCVTDPEEAEETTVLFSQYLRTNLDSLRNQESVPFSTELGHIQTYVELEKKRFGDKLNVSYDIQERNFLVPSLSLQPIVENSIKHGIRAKNEAGHVLMGSYKRDNGYLIIIEDDGVGFDPDQPLKDDGKSHVGMQNVQERLRLMCHATMKIESSPGKGCRTEIWIPE